MVTTGRRRRRKAAHTQAGPVTITHADGTTSTEAPLSPKQLRRVLDAHEPRGWRARGDDPEARPVT